MSLHKERPILFSAPMVRAILEGRKSQTRRVVKSAFGSVDLQGAGHVQELHPGYWQFASEKTWVMPERDSSWSSGVPCPYGMPGDRLWVKERALFWTGGAGGTSDVCYADDPKVTDLLRDRSSIEKIRESQPEEWKDIGNWKWRSSIHMPRWASRMLLEVVRVRVERVQDISGEDVLAEGFDRPLRREYAELWESINGAGAWDANPWVWVVEFKVLESL